MSTKIFSKHKTGDIILPHLLETIHQRQLSIPDGDGKWIHLQFRRYAGCPICNLHLRSFARRADEIVAANVHEIVIFHSSVREMLKYQDSLPFDVVADPEKTLYHEFGVESSPTALLNPKVWGAIAAGIVRFPPATVAEGGKSGLPADFLIAPDGHIVACHYGQHANDQWEVEELLTLVKSTPGKV